MRHSYIPLIQLTRMSRRAKPISMKELCEVFQRRNRLIFGERTLAEQQEPPEVASRSFEKDRENPSPFENSDKLLTHLPPVHEQQIRRSRSRSKFARVASPQYIKHTAVVRHRTSLRRVSQFPNIQGQQRTPQQAKMVTTQPSVARQNDAEENAERSEQRTTFIGDTKMYRPCLAHTSLAVPETRTTIPQSETNVGHLQPETVLVRHEPSESEQSTKKHQGAIKQQEQKPGAHPSSGRHLKPLSASAQQNPRENKQSIGNHQSATKQQQRQRAREDRKKPTAGRRVAGMNQVIQQRRQETSELVQSSGRRIARCSKTDPAQQHRTFIRVLRKRF